MRTPWHINFYQHKQFLIQTGQQRRNFSHGSNGFTYFMLEKINSWKTLIHDIQVRYHISEYKDKIQKVWQMIWNYEKYTIIETLKTIVKYTWSVHNSKKELRWNIFQTTILQNRRNSIRIYSQPTSLMLKTNQTRSWLTSILIEENSQQDIMSHI